MEFINYKTAFKLFEIERDMYDDIIKLAYSTSSHPQIYEVDGVRFTVADLVVGQGSIAGKGGKKIKPDMSKRKGVGLATLVQGEGFGKVKNMG